MRRRCLLRGAGRRGIICSIVFSKRFFRLKVRGERLKARSFYRFALNYFYVVAQRAVVALAGLVARVVLGAAEPRGLNDNSSQFYSSIIVNFFPFCGLEECAMHIDNPQMRGLFFCGVTRHRRGYDRLRLQRSLCGGAAGIFYRNNRKNRHANSILTAERIINS